MNIIETELSPGLEPLTANRKLLECQCAGTTLKELVLKRFAKVATDLTLSILDCFWPSEGLFDTLVSAKDETVIKSEEGVPLAWASHSGDIPETPASELTIDKESVYIRYSWDLLAVNEIVIGALSENRIDGTVREGVVIDGFVEIGKGTVLLPGVYIEGNVIIGENAKIGPNCYIRGNTSIGDKCHVGQSVEIKNSILMDGVSAGHLSYVGDSIIGKNSNLGAGTVTANFRHDGKNHRSEVDGELIDTGRRKFGSIFGDDVHTGIHTSIYPGRKIWPGMMTRPGDCVSRDLK